MMDGLELADGLTRRNKSILPARYQIRSSNLAVLKSLLQIVRRTLKSIRLYLLYIFGYWFADALRLPRVLRRGAASRASLFIDSVDDPWWSLAIMPPQTDCSVFTLHQLQYGATRAAVPGQHYQHTEIPEDFVLKQVSAL